MQMNIQGFSRYRVVGFFGGIILLKQYRFVKGTALIGLVNASLILSSSSLGATEASSFSVLPQNLSANNSGQLLAQRVDRSRRNRQRSSRNSFHLNIFRQTVGGRANLVSTGMERAKFDKVHFEPQYYIPRGAGSSLRSVYFREGVWEKGSSGDRKRCSPSSPRKGVTKVPVPASFRTSSHSANHFSIFEMPDGSIREVDLFQWCKGYSTPVSNNRVRDFNPRNNPIKGAKGGSNLSGYIGGIFPGDLTGSKENLGYVLDMTLPLAHLSPEGGGYVWPAGKADRNHKKRYKGRNPNVKMGALLALPRSFPVSSLETEPARKIARTMMAYGAIVRNATPGNVIQYVVNIVPGKESVRSELRRELGYDPTRNSRKPTPFYRDMLKIQQSLKVVKDNTSSTPGGRR